MGLFDNPPPENFREEKKSRVKKDSADVIIDTKPHLKLKKDNEHIKDALILLHSFYDKIKDKESNMFKTYKIDIQNIIKILEE